jgi:hypothetical protein
MASVSYIVSKAIYLFRQKIVEHHLLISILIQKKGTHIAVGTHLGPVEIWDVERTKKIRKLKGHTARVGN